MHGKKSVCSRLAVGMCAIAWLMYGAVCVDGVLVCASTPGFQPDDATIGSGHAGNPARDVRGRGACEPAAARYQVQWEYDGLNSRLWLDGQAVGETCEIPELAASAGLRIGSPHEPFYGTIRTINLTAWMPETWRTESERK